MCIITDSADASIKFNGTAINKIPNILKVMTGKSSLQVGKKSLMFLERVPVFNKGHTDSRYSDNSYMQARIFSIKEDGSLAKSFVFSPVDNTGSMYIGNDWDVKMTRPVISNQASSSGYIAMFQGANGRNDSSISAKFPVQTLDRSGAGTDASFSPQNITDISKSGWTNFYGNGSLSLPTYNGEVFASAHSLGKSSLNNGDPVTLTLSFIKYTSDGKIEHDTEKDFTLYTVTDDGFNHASMTTGDLDNDGYKNDVALLVFNNKKIRLFIYTITYDRTTGNPALVKRYEKLVKDYSQSRVSYGSDNKTSYSNDNKIVATGNVVCGNFAEDGTTKIAIVFSWDDLVNQLVMYHWNGEKEVFEEDTKYPKDWDNTRLHYAPLHLGCQAVAADLDGDEVDELVMVVFNKSNYNTTNTITKDAEISPWIWVCDFNDDLFTYTEFWNDDVPKFGMFYETKYFANEAFSLAAGAFTGKLGKKKTVDDLALCFADTSKQIYIITSPTDDSGNYARDNGYLNFSYRKIYDSNEIDSSMSGKYNSAGKFYGGLLAADFLGEGIEISNPQQTVDIHDPTYAVILPAFPYHVDNLNDEGTALINHPNNFSFSGFDDPTNGGGEMSLTYKKSEKTSSSSNLSFTSTATEDTFFPNTDSQGLKVVDDYLQLKRMSSHMLADFGGDTKAGQMGGIAAKVYDFFNNHAETVTTQMNSSSTMMQIEENFSAKDRDAILMFDAKTYIWRYKILSNYLPTWFLNSGNINDVASVNENPVEVPDKGVQHYITFSMQDDIVKTNKKTNTYQPRHEEGNLFSYPARLSENEGYNPDGNLMNGTAHEFFVPDGNASGFGLKFSKTDSVENHYKQEETPSEASKTLNFFESAWNDVKNFFTGGNETIEPTPDQTEHSQNFTKTFAEDESIYVKSRFRTTLQGGSRKTSVGYTVGLMPYLSKEGTMRVASYVQLETDPTENYYLWNKNSLYVKSADPALLLPEKFTTNGSTFAAQNNHTHAMKMRGVRIYSKSYGGYSTPILIPGLSYRIEVPVYNASFKDAGDVKVRLSCSKELNPTVKQDTSRTIIQEKTINLKGWDNVVNSVADGTSNRGVVNFDWTVPDSIEDGNYYFYVDIDPDNAIVEVHESRMKSPTEVADCGGNNEGYFPFSIFHLNAENAQKVARGSSVAPNGVLYASSVNGGGAVRASTEVEQTPKLNTKVRFNGSENIDSVYAYLRQAKIISPDDEVVIDCEVENVTAVVFPEVILYGLNLKPGEEYFRDNEDGETEFNYEAFSNAFLRHEMMLFPNDVTRFTFSVKPSDIDFDNNAIFALVIPNMPITNSGNGEGDYPEPVIDDDAGEEPSEPSQTSGPGSSGGGCDVGFGSMIMISLAGLYALRKK